MDDGGDESTSLIRSAKGSSNENKKWCHALAYATTLLGLGALCLGLWGKYANGVVSPHQQHHRHVIELAQFSLVNDSAIGVDSFIEDAKALQGFFEGTNGSAVSRSLVLNEGVWSDIVHWTSMTAASKAAEDILVWPQAQPFLSSINATTLTLSHAAIQLDWTAPSSTMVAPVVELASFTLVPDVDDTEFVGDGKMTTPFFETIGTAAHRILAQGYEDSSLWLDLVYWTSEPAAITAAEAIEDVPETHPFLQAIDIASERFSFTYSNVMLQQEFQRE